MKMSVHFSEHVLFLMGLFAGFLQPLDREWNISLPRTQSTAYTLGNRYKGSVWLLMPGKESGRRKGKCQYFENSTTHLQPESL